MEVLAPVSRRRPASDLGVVPGGVNHASRTLARVASDLHQAAMATPALSPIAAFARAHDPDRFLTAIFMPAKAREAFFSLIAFNHELARAREATTNPVAALIRLQWWRDAVAEAAAGAPARRHEVAAPRHAAIVSGALAADDRGTSQGEVRLPLRCARQRGEVHSQRPAVATLPAPAAR